MSEQILAFAVVVMFAIDCCSHRLVLRIYLYCVCHCIYIYNDIYSLLSLVMNHSISFFRTCISLPQFIVCLFYLFMYWFIYLLSLLMCYARINIRPHHPASGTSTGADGRFDPLWSHGWEFDLSIAHAHYSRHRVMWGFILFPTHPRLGEDWGMHTIDGRINIRNSYQFNVTSISFIYL